MERLPQLEDDGLVTPEVGDWGEEKYLLVQGYARMFSTSMKGKWDERVYADLFSGAGRARIKGTDRIVPSSALLAVQIPDRFDRYLFCDSDRGKLSGLEARVRTVAPGVPATFLHGDANALVGQVLSSIPRGDRHHRVLTLCFVDPFACSNLRFDTVRELSERFVDFLVLIPSGMDAHRNQAWYEDPLCPILDDFLGGDSWRSEWERARAERPKLAFGDFVADTFGRRMQQLSYIYPGLEFLQRVRSTEKNLPLYHLGMFSRHPLGAKFWREARKSSSSQRTLSFD